MSSTASTSVAEGEGRLAQTPETRYGGDRGLAVLAEVCVVRLSPAAGSSMLPLPVPTAVASLVLAIDREMVATPGWAGASRSALILNCAFPSSASPPKRPLRSTMGDCGSYEHHRHHNRGDQRSVHEHPPTSPKLRKNDLSPAEPESGALS